MFSRPISTWPTDGSSATHPAFKVSRMSSNAPSGGERGYSGHSCED